MVAHNYILPPIMYERACFTMPWPVLNIIYLRTKGQNKWHFPVIFIGIVVYLHIVGCFSFSFVKFLFASFAHLSARFLIFFLTFFINLCEFYLIKVFSGCAKVLHFYKVESAFFLGDFSCLESCVHRINK